MRSKTFKSASILVFLAILGCKIATEDTTLTASSKKSDFKTNAVTNYYSSCMMTVFSLKAYYPCSTPPPAGPTPPPAEPNRLSVVVSSKYISTVENSELLISVNGLEVGESVHVVIPSLNWAGVDVAYKKPATIDTIDLEKGLSAGQHIADGEYTFTTDKGGNGTIKIDNTPPVVEIIESAGTMVKSKAYDPVVNGVSSGVNIDSLTEQINLGGYIVNSSTISRACTKEDSGSVCEVESKISKNFGIASLQDTPFLIANETSYRVSLKPTDNVFNAKQDNEVRVFKNGCSSTNGIYDIPAVYNFDFGGPDLTFVFSLSKNYFDTKNPNGNYNLLPPEYRDIIDNPNNDKHASSIKRNIKVTIDGASTNLLSGSGGWDRDENVSWYRFIDARSNPPEPYNPFSYASVLLEKRNAGDKNFYIWADLVSDRYPIANAKVNIIGRKNYFQLGVFSVNLTPTYEKLTVLKTIGGKQFRVPKDNTMAKMEISIGNKKINFNLGLNKYVKQGSKYKWDLSCTTK